MEKSNTKCCEENPRGPQLINSQQGGEAESTQTPTQTPYMKQKTTDAEGAKHKGIVGSLWSNLYSLSVSQQDAFQDLFFSVTLLLMKTSHLLNI